MPNKRFFIIVGAVVVGAVAITYWFSTRPEPQAPTYPTGFEQNEFDPNNPGFVTGNVTEVTASHVFFMVNGVNAVARVNFSTVMVKQVTGTGGVITLQAASVSDFTPGSFISVHFDSPPEDNVYDSTRIQLITK